MDQEEVKQVLKQAAYAEVKQEVSIDRKTGTASRAGPRSMERVPAGTEFELNISLRVFEQDDEKGMVGYVKEALALLQQDYLGASGTRGCGWVEVKNLEVAKTYPAG